MAGDDRDDPTRPPRSAPYPQQPSRPFRTPRIDEITHGGTDLALDSITPTGDAERDALALEAYRDFRAEAEGAGLRHVLEVFAPNVPVPMKDVARFLNAGVFLGLAWGAIWLKKAGWFDAKGPAWKLILRFVLGIAGVAVLWMGLGQIFPDGETWLPLILRYIRYALVGLWVAGIAPLLFIRLRLANKSE